MVEDVDSQQVLDCINTAKEKTISNEQNNIEGSKEILNNLIKCLLQISSPISPLKETGGFAKYNITEGRFPSDDDKSNLTRYINAESNEGIKKDVKRIISFLTPGEGDEIEGRYMDNIYPAMALQTAEILYGKL